MKAVWKRIESARKKTYRWKWYIIRFNNITSDWCCFLKFQDKKEWLGMSKKLSEAKKICYQNYEHKSLNKQNDENTRNK